MKTTKPCAVIASRDGVTAETLSHFRSIIYGHYRSHPRLLPWRETDDPYRILVSEIMLQQTRVERVLDKYHQFLTAFPDIPSLARASLGEVLAAWQGLGYNRRALFLKNAVVQVMERFRGCLPSSPDELRTLPGIGTYTAAAVSVFAFHQPLPLIETNIRSVFIHFFFSDREAVKDSEILPLLNAALDRDKPREWHYALMDYGAMLKRTLGNPSRRSAHHGRQSPFEGSDRQIRGKIVKLLIEGKYATADDLMGSIAVERLRVGKILDQMEKEGFLKKKGNRYVIPE